MSRDLQNLDLPPCGASAQADGSLCWSVWAPQASSVELVLFGSGGERRTVQMQLVRAGFFQQSEPERADGQRYAYRLDGRPERPDPASRWQPDGVHRPSAVVLPDQFQWSEVDWQGVSRDQLVIYELHVGTFTPEGTFDAMHSRLEALRELGITAIELMPVAQFSGERGWGYDGVHPYAVQNSYGGPRGLQRLVNACHEAGLAVILDAVFNHLGPEGNYLSEFGPYFTDRHRTPWGQAFNFDGHGSDVVRQFVLDNVRQWIRDFHVDGLRLDAVQAIFDHGPRHILSEIKQTADEEGRRLGRPIHVIAESNLNDVRLLNSVDRGGYGLDAQWSDDFHHSVHSLLTGERNGYYVDFGKPEHLLKALNRTFVYDGCYSAFHSRRHGASASNHTADRFVVSIQNHDQVGNRARGDRFGTLLDPAQQRLAAGLLLLSPYIPLLFMGEEYGETRPFPYFCSFSDAQLIEAVRRGRRREFDEFDWPGEIPDPHGEETFQSAKLSWSWPENSWHAGLRRLYGDLLAARRQWPPLREFDAHCAELLPGSGSPGMLRLVRGRSSAQPDVVVAYFNLGGNTRPVLEAAPNGLTLLCSSETAHYGGASGLVDADQPFQPFEFRVFGRAEWRMA